MELVAARCALWWTVLRISMAERLAYRGDFALGTLMRFLPIITQMFLWTAVFAGAGRDELGGLSVREMSAYLLLTMVSRAFSSMPGLATGIAREIRTGEVKKYLIQPIDMIGFLLLGRVAHKLVYYTVAAGPFALVFFLFRDLFDGWPDPGTLAAFFAALMLAFLLGFFLEATLGMIGFWFLEVESLVFGYMLISFFFSGHMFPITLLPSPWDDVVAALPLQYLAYFPAAVLLGKIEGPELWRGLAIQAAWVAFFIVACRAAYGLGLRRYSGYGG